MAAKMALNRNMEVLLLDTHRLLLEWLPDCR